MRPQPKRRCPLQGHQDARWLASAAIALVCGSAIGCGPQTNRLAVSGQVSLDGSPLDNGSIRFTSLGESLLATGALIRDGRYSIPKEKGLTPGIYRVEISSPDEDAAPVYQRNDRNQPGIPTAVDRIPAAYNVESEQQVEVVLGERNTFDFDILSK